MSEGIQVLDRTLYPGDSFTFYYEYGPFRLARTYTYEEIKMDRTRVTIIVEVDLDPVPGWGSTPEDFVAHILKRLDDTIPHYNPSVRLLGEDEFIAGPPINDEGDTRAGNN